MPLGSKKSPKRKRGRIILNAHYKLYVEEFTRWLHLLGYASSTVRSTVSDLVNFLGYLQTQQIITIDKITQEHIRNYNTFLHAQPYAETSIYAKLRSIEMLSEYLEKTQEKKLVLTKLKVEKGIAFERLILTQQEIQLLFKVLEETPVGLLKRTILHLCYSCGLRAGEAVALQLSDIDYKKKLLYIAPGKNYHSRYVPFNDHVAKEFMMYEKYGRAAIHHTGNQFLVSLTRDRANQSILRRLFKEIVLKTNLPVELSPHCLRHSIATHLLQQGLELESIAQFLGHRSLKSTQIYVRINHEITYYNEITTS